MEEEIHVPAMGESITEAEIGSFLKPSGSFVREGDEVVELETEKVNQVLYAPIAGTITWRVGEGDAVKIGDVLGVVDSEGAAATSEDKKEETEKHPAPPGEKKEEAPASSKEEKPAKNAQGKRIMQEEFVADVQAKPVQPKQEKKSIKKRETRKQVSKIRKTIADRLVDALQTAAM